MSFNYSVAIRTLGTAGEKYNKLINSIKNQTITPERVVVVLPKGYDPPEYRLGYERFVFSPKGMIEQRLYAVDYIESDYILFCDDDVEFPADFVSKLSDALMNGGYDCAAGPLLEFFPPRGAKYIMASLLGGACVMLHGRSSQYVRLLNTGGWSYNRSIDTDIHKFYNTDSLAWTCFCVNRKAVRSIHFEDEVWAGRNGYAAYDDQLFFVKLALNGYRSCVVSDAIYKHNDGKTSIRDLRLEPIYAHAHNHVVFWHRCMYSVCRNPIKKLWMMLCLNYYIVMNLLYQRIKDRGNINHLVYNAVHQGFCDGKEFLKSPEYQQIPSVLIKRSECY